jgi:hypothetical protein
VIRLNGGRRSKTDKSQAKRALIFNEGGYSHYQTLSSAIRSIAGLSFSTQPISKTANFITSMPTCDCIQLIDDHPIRPRATVSSRHRYCGALRQELPLKSDRQLRKIIDDLRELERKCFASRSRFAFYDYLAAVFELYVQLRRTNQAKPSARRIAKLFSFRSQKRSHCIRVIIDATSTADNKTKSRWTRALRYAWHERRTGKDLRSFLRENGGPAGCADQFAAINSSGRYPGCIVYRRPGTGRPYLIVHRAA